MAGNHSRRPADPALCSLLQPGVLEGLLAAVSHFLAVLLEAGEQASLARFRLRAELLEVVTALVCGVGQGVDGPLQHHGGVVKGIFAAAGELVPVGVQTGQHTALAEGDVLAVGLELGSFQILRASLMRASSRKVCSSGLTSNILRG